MDKMKLNTAIGEEYSNRMRRYFIDALDKIVDNSEMLVGDKVKEIIFNFEEDIYKFQQFSKESEMSRID